MTQINFIVDSIKLAGERKTAYNSTSYVKQQKFSTKFGSNATPLENREKFGQAEA
jgi:hypothetical protein